LGKTIALRFENVKVFLKTSPLRFENDQFQTNFAQPCPYVNKYFPEIQTIPRTIPLVLEIFAKRLIFQYLIIEPSKETLEEYLPHHFVFSLGSK
jgi:hypothetical protein